MSEDDAKKWVKNKKNQQEVVDKFFKNYKVSQQKMAVFMAGIPGAGKTEFAENTIKLAMPSLVPVEHDKLVEYIKGYLPENYYNFRSAGNVLVTRIFRDCLKNNYPILFDGTLSQDKGYKNIELCLKKGYRVTVIYIVQDAQKAWELTQARELVKKRAIERSGFMQTCSKINGNLLLLFKRFKDHGKFSFWVLNKRGQTDMSNAISIIHDPTDDQSEIIEKFLQKQYNVGNI